LGATGHAPIIALPNLRVHYAAGPEVPIDQAADQDAVRPTIAAASAATRFGSSAGLQRGSESGARGVRAQIDAGLVAVMQAWPRRPEAIRAGIMAMVRAGVMTESSGRPPVELVASGIV
jgi:hypothetical protein